MNGFRVTDLHCDSIGLIQDGKAPVNNHNFSQKYCQLQFFAVFVDNIALEAMRETAFSQIKAFEASFDGVIVKSSDGLKNALSSEKSALLSLEGGSFIDSVSLLDLLCEKGIRSFMPAWNNASRICATNRESGSLRDYGITDFGREIIKRADEKKIILDVSHLSDKGFFDLAEITNSPFIASHSNSRAVCPNPRNLTDEMIRIIIERKGLIGLNLFPPFVSRNDLFSDVFNHIDHILSLGGEDAVSFGFDIDGTDGMYFCELPRFTSIHDFFISELEKRYSADFVAKISYKNADDFLLRHFS